MGKLKSSKVEVRHMWNTLPSSSVLQVLGPPSSCSFSTFCISSHLSLPPVTCLQGGGASRAPPRLSGLGRVGGWDVRAHPLPGPAPCWFTPHNVLLPVPLLPGLWNPFPYPGLPRTLALGYTGGAIEVSACVSWTAGAEVLTEVGLIGPHGTADTAMDAGVIVVPGGALDCRQRGEGGVRVAGRWEFWGMGRAGHIHPGELGH